jgi:hypothetical protein
MGSCTGQVHSTNVKLLFAYFHAKHAILRSKKMTEVQATLFLAGSILMGLGALGAAPPR